MHNVCMKRKENAVRAWEENDEKKTQVHDTDGRWEATELQDSKTWTNLSLSFLATEYGIWKATVHDDI